jgi:hypothetical protein
MRAGVLLLLVLASCGSTAAQPQTAVPEALALWTPSPAKGLAPKVEGHLGHAVCVGPALTKDPPHTASCCYPAMELIKRPIRGAFPALRACYEARQNRSAEGRVVFAFRIEQDGSVQRVCAGEASTMDDEPAVRCMVEVIRKIRWEAMGTPKTTKENRDLCGLISLKYPVVFEP